MVERQRERGRGNEEKELGTVKGKDGLDDGWKVTKSRAVGRTDGRT